MRLLSIPENEYENYRLDVIFNGYKWDPQYSDINTIAKHALVITEDEHKQLETLTEKLYIETVNAEEFLFNNPHARKPLKLPQKISNELNNIENYDAKKHIRLMRFDFHPLTDGGWAISEVNSDVPGGFAEASVMPEIALKYFNKNNLTVKQFGNIFTEKVTEKVKAGGKIVIVHCTSYSDDRQTMQFIGDKLEAEGFKIVYAAADHLTFDEQKAICLLEGYDGDVDAIIRFTPLEWLITIKPKCRDGYFHTTTISCNHPVAVFAQTKRFPFVWEELQKQGIDLSTWKLLLPETLEINDAKTKEGFIYKPIYGRVGENISIKEACRENEYAKILKDVRKNKKKYIAQKRFICKSIEDENNNKFHVCLGAYCIDGKTAGYYARMSTKPRIDSSSADVPVLIETGID